VEIGTPPETLMVSLSNHEGFIRTRACNPLMDCRAPPSHLHEQTARTFRPALHRA